MCVDNDSENRFNKANDDEGINQPIIMSVKFKVHKVKDSDFSSLYKDVPRNILPADYGGEGPSIAELTGKSPIH